MREQKRSFDFRKYIIDPLQLFLSSSQHGESIWNGGSRGGERKVDGKEVKCAERALFK